MGSEGDETEQALGIQPLVGHHLQAKFALVHPAPGAHQFYQGFAVTDGATGLDHRALGSGQDFLFDLGDLVERGNPHRTDHIAIETAGAAPNPGQTIVLIEPLLKGSITGVEQEAIGFGQGVRANKIGIDLAGIAV